MNTKWYFGLDLGDYQGGDEDGIIYDNLDDILNNDDGAKFLIVRFQDMEIYLQNQGTPRSFTKFFNDFSKITNDLVEKARQEPTKAHTHSLGFITPFPVPVIVTIHPASEFDIRFYDAA